MLVIQPDDNSGALVVCGVIQLHLFCPTRSNSWGIAEFHQARLCTAHLAIKQSSTRGLATKSRAFEEVWGCLRLKVRHLQKLRSSEMAWNTQHHAKTRDTPNIPRNII